MRSIFQFLTGGACLFFQRSHYNRLLPTCWFFVLYSQFFSHAGVPFLLLVGSLSYLRENVLALLVTLRNADGMIVNRVRMRTNVFAAID